MVLAADYEAAWIIRDKFLGPVDSFRDMYRESTYRSKPSRTADTQRLGRIR